MTLEIEFSECDHGDLFDHCEHRTSKSANIFRKSLILQKHTARDILTVLDSGLCSWSAMG